MGIVRKGGIPSLVSIAMGGLFGRDANQEIAMDKVYRLKEWTKENRQLPAEFIKDLENVAKEKQPGFLIENDFLVCIVLRLAVEVGWRLYPNECMKGGGWFDMKAPCWPGEGVRCLNPAHYKADLHLFSKEPLCSLLASPVGDDTLIFNITFSYGQVKNIFSMPSLALKPSKYVAKQKGAWEEILIGIDELTQKFQNTFAMMRDEALTTYHGYTATADTLPGLPEELLPFLAKHLSLRDVINLTKCCKLLKETWSSEIVWMILYKKDFGEPPIVNVEQAYKTAYKDKILRSTRSIVSTSSESFHYPEYYNSTYFM